MNRWWIRNVAFHPIDAHGDVILGLSNQQPEPVSPEEDFAEWGRSWGLPAWYTAKLWAEQQARQNKAG